ncbi:MAG: PDZ domain-containing protein, partial [Candidatus Caenarcaniphilales bacterium]|nr:PDZ domain-containing protein [Candidatus Caenarcaniphilales bacterium]
KGKDEKVVIKEIPLGITWEVEKVPPAPQKEQEKNAPLDEQSQSIAMDSKPDKKPNEKKEEKSDPSKTKPPSGVPNSDSVDRKNLPDKLPKLGYIGVQLSEILFQGQVRSYIAFVYPNTSAERAGLKTGDFIVSINGKPASGLNAFQVSHMVRGPLGTVVDLVVFREGEGEKRIKAYRTGNIFNENELLDPLNKGKKPNGFNSEPSPQEIQKLLQQKIVPLEDDVKL